MTSDTSTGNGDSPAVFHVTDRRRDLVHLRLPAGVALVTGDTAAGELDRVVLRTSSGERIGHAVFTHPVPSRRRSGGRRAAAVPVWVTDDGAASGSLDAAVEHLLRRCGHEPGSAR